MRVLLVGDDANNQNLLQKGRPFIMRLPGPTAGTEYFVVSSEECSALYAKLSIVPGSLAAPIAMST